MNETTVNIKSYLISKGNNLNCYCFLNYKCNYQLCNALCGRKGESSMPCRAGFFLPVRQPAGALRLRLAVSLWAATGSFTQDPHLPQEKAPALSPYLKVWKIRSAGPFGVCRLHVFVWGICKSPCILQISVPLRHLVRCNPSA